MSWSIKPLVVSFTTVSPSLLPIEVTNPAMILLALEVSNHRSGNSHPPGNKLTTSLTPFITGQIKSTFEYSSPFI